uniref:Uncharacterized protein n=1 Tax=Anopheles minimus TaxID=112268 RepID=A0A182WPS6_9DIPT
MGKSQLPETDHDRQRDDNGQRSSMGSKTTNYKSRNVPHTHRCWMDGWVRSQCLTRLNCILKQNKQTKHRSLFLAKFIYSLPSTDPSTDATIFVGAANEMIV